MNAATKFDRIFIACTTTMLLALCGCQGLTSSNGGSGSGTGNSNATLQNSVNHIVFIAQENRSFDTYFGQLPAYWQANGFPSQQFDGMPANASNPTYDGTGTVNAYHVQTECTENLTPSWDESHLDYNLHNPYSTSATMDGFVYNAAKFGIDESYYDTAGIRAMGYYDASDLNYYYFMASNFATSDRWFSPAMDRTQINRMYLYAATSQGYAYPPGSNSNDNHPLTAKTIFDSLNAAGVSWKVYETDPNSTYLTQFAEFAPPNPLPANVVPASDFLSDANSGNLPAVSVIEGGYSSGTDEHPDNNVQSGAAYMESLINGFMQSKAWSSSIFILTYDEGGGLYDHVAPQATVNPDGIAPVDLNPGDICTGNTGSAVDCDFNMTGFRVPLIVISPFTKKNYVSHTVTDYTAILKLIETRFNLSALTARDQQQFDMTEFFDFQNPPWMTPPSNIPTQYTTGLCNYQNLQ